jgi:hypothetical protein
MLPPFVRFRLAFHPCDAPWCVRFASVFVGRSLSVRPSTRPFDRRANSTASAQLMRAEAEGGGCGWTGSRGTICQTLQGLVAGHPDVEFHWHTRAEVIDFVRGHILITNTAVAGGGGDVSGGGSGDDGNASAPTTLRAAAGASETHTFDLVVGADGAGSSVRAAIFAHPHQDGEPQVARTVTRFNNGNFSLMLAFDRHRASGNIINDSGRGRGTHHGGDSGSGDDVAVRLRQQLPRSEPELDPSVL